MINVKNAEIYLNNGDVPKVKKGSRSKKRKGSKLTQGLSQKSTNPEQFLCSRVKVFFHKGQGQNGPDWRPLRSFLFKGRICPESFFVGPN